MRSDKSVCSHRQPLNHPRQHSDDHDKARTKTKSRTSTTKDDNVHERLILYSCAQNTSRAKGTSLPNKVDDDDDNGVGDDNDDRS